MSITRAKTTRLVLLLFAVSCNPLCAAEPTKLVVFGDSTTAKRGELMIYAGILQEELPRKGLPVDVINAGVGGNHTGHARARFDKDVLDEDPGMVIIQFGINDAAVDVWKDPPATKPRVSMEDFAENIRHFVRTLKARKTQVILMTPNPLRWTPKMRELYGKPPYLSNETNGFNTMLEAYADTTRQIANAENVPLIDVYRSFQLFGSSEGQSVDDLLLDGIHPNERGHRLVADQLIALLLKSGQSDTQASSATIEVKIVDNPADSSLREANARTTNVRFEDYVSNPPPNHRDPVQGWVAQFPTPFAGLRETNCCEHDRFATA